MSTSTIKPNGRHSAPQDVEAEMAAIGAMILDGATIATVDSIVSPSDYTDTRHAILHNHLVKLHEAGAPVDLVSLRSHLADAKALDTIGGVEYLLALGDSLPSAASAKYYAELVKKKSMQRRAIADAERALQAALRGDDIEVSSAPAFTWHTAAEFDALDLVCNYHIPNVLAAGPVPTILCGAFKTLKTSMALALLFALATGSRFLGHFLVNCATRVAMMSGESGAAALQSLLRRIARSCHWPLSAVGSNLRICSAVPNLSVAGHLTAIERTIVENDLRVICIDPFYLAAAGLRTDEAGSLFAVGRFLDPLARIAERTGCTPIVVHHNSRGATRANVGEPAELADVAWAGLPEWAGQWLLLARREKYDPDSNGHHRLWLTIGGRDGHSGLVGVNVTEGNQSDPEGRRWEVEVEQAADARRAIVEAEQDRREQDRQARQAKQLEQDRDAIVTAMRTAPDGETATAIRNLAGLRSDRATAAIASLLADGSLIPCVVNKGNGRDYEGVKLSQRDATGRNRTPPGQKGCPDAGQQERDTTYVVGVPVPLHRCDVPTCEAGEGAA